MPEVKVTHQSITDDEAKKPPKRDPVPQGYYHATIVEAKQRSTNHKPPLAKISVEFQILFQTDENGEDKDGAHQGRRVYQDYILEPEDGKPDMNDIRRYELRQFLDATGIPYTDDGFNTDHLAGKTVLILVKHRTGKQADEDGNFPTFTNVRRVDSVGPVSADDLA